MKKNLRQYLFIIILLIASVLMGLNYIYRPFQIPEEELRKNIDTEVIQTGSLEVKKSAQDTLEKLSDEEKISQMIAQPLVIVPSFEVTQSTNSAQASNSAQKTNLAEDTKFAQSLVTGFYTLFGKGVSAQEATNITTNIKSQSTVYDLAPLFAVDHEGGEVQRLSGEGFTKLDSWRTICGLTTEVRTEILSQSASELKKAGIDIVLGPVLDVGNNRILKERVCSTDSYAIVADRSMDFVSTFANQGILSVLKHFPGIGLTTKDLHTTFDYVTVLENDVKLYKYILDQVENVGVMTSHVGVSSQDREIPCSVSPYCVNELYKAYPEILIFTDALEMEAAGYNKDNPRVRKDLFEVSREAILAGNDVLLYGPSVTNQELQELISNLVIQYRVNPQIKTFVDEAVLKIIEYKYEVQ